MSTLAMEVALAKYFGIRRYIIVPNVSWGLGLHECDLLILTKKDLYATEVEIKRTKYDLIKDLEKRHSHYSSKIKNLFFAIPESLTPHIEHIPDQAGIIIITEKRGKLYCNIARRARANTKARPFTQDEVNKLLHLGIMRIWRVKEKLSKLL